MASKITPELVERHLLILSTLSNELHSDSALSSICMADMDYDTALKQAMTEVKAVLIQSKHEEQV